MKRIFCKQMADQSQPNLSQIQREIKDCHTQSMSSNQVLHTSKSNQSLSKKSINEMNGLQRVSQDKNEDNIVCTEQPLNLNHQQYQRQEQVTNCLMVQKPAFNFKRHSTRGQTEDRRKRNSQLKDVILSRKVNGLKQLFCNKIKRNNQYSPAVDYHCDEDFSQQSLMNHRGIELRQIDQKIIGIISIYNIVSSIFIFTLSMVFPQVTTTLTINIIQFIGFFLFIIEIILNFITIRFSLGRKLQTIQEISQDYFRGRFAVDCSNILVIFIYILTRDTTIGYFRLITFFKLHDCIEKLQKLQVFFIENYYNQQYWSLIKVFLFNFCFAHMLAIILMAMANLSSDKNWLINKGIADSPWYQQYIWAYYWGTTIMLTIGFGDLTPVSYKQALCMVFIETISCMVLAYNINCVGSLIANIRSQDIEKSKNMKIFKKLADKHKIDQSLSSKINNYIEENANIKKLFNIQEEAQFVTKLPRAFRTDYLKQANKTIFKKLFFFDHLMKKTLFSLAEKIQMKITHPQELIHSIEKNLDIFILKNGEIGYISKKPNRKYNKHIFNRIKLAQGDSPFLLNTNFITKNSSEYGIKSIVYSVLYYLQYDKLISILKESNMDYELYCRYRDKNRNKIDQFQVVQCQFCSRENHTKFSCPKLHYLPLTQHTINRYLYKQKTNHNKRRNNFHRLQIDKASSLISFLSNKQIYNQKKQQATILKDKRVKRPKYSTQQFRTMTNSNEQKLFMKSRIDKFKNSIDAIAQLQSKFLQNTSQIIKAQISKAMTVQQIQDEVWLIDLDRLKNFKGYFTQNNPSNLHQAFSLEGRIQKITKDIHLEKQ